VFEGQFCDMNAQKWAILSWPMLTFYRYVIAEMLLK
jgi:hypothetical protein